MDKICYVTLFYNIGRDSNMWGKFKRSFEDYYKRFEPFIKLFDKNNCKDDKMVIFIDKEYYDILNDRIENSNMFLIPIDENFMNKLYMWKTMDKEISIMKDEQFKNILGDRSEFPEHVFPKYTLINHSKIDLICWLINNNIMIDFNYYAWVDFGFFKNEFLIPDDLLDINRFDKNKINYTLINRIDEKDRDIIYTLQNAPEKIAGCFFFGRKDILLEYQNLYHQIFNWFQNELKIADDDQHLVLQCFFKNSDLFKFHWIDGWHQVFICFQR